MAASLVSCRAAGAEAGGGRRRRKARGAAPGSTSSSPWVTRRSCAQAQRSAQARSSSTRSMDYASSVDACAPGSCGLGARLASHVARSARAARAVGRSAASRSRRATAAARPGGRRRRARAGCARRRRAPAPGPRPQRRAAHCSRGRNVLRRGLVAGARLSRLAREAELRRPEPDPP